MQEATIKIDASTASLLRVCAHCSDCLDQIVSAPNKIKVILHYKNDKGEYVEWSPNSSIKEK